LFRVKKKRRFRVQDDRHFSLENFISYLKLFEKVYDNLVKEGLLPEDDKKFRKAMIQSFNKKEIVDLLSLTPEKPQA